ncbi:hypothetical protein B0H15DRAFT_461913 [Mycena belliarum]|uniref:Uncharacterized protein n=1 Tax=Mycena belliarum TaxID=1033014 RepID=A0AAD6UJC6_9AGAR|nr:hypothetical protein B0H15DRAFT_461913 [Mycena belliae]
MLPRVQDGTPLVPTHPSSFTTHTYTRSGLLSRGMIHNPVKVGSVLFVLVNRLLAFAIVSSIRVFVRKSKKSYHARPNYRVAGIKILQTTAADKLAVIFLTTQTFILPFAAVFL